MTSGTSCRITPKDSAVQSALGLQPHTRPAGTAKWYEGRPCECSHSASVEGHRMAPLFIATPVTHKWQWWPQKMMMLSAHVSTCFGIKKKDRGGPWFLLGILRYPAPPADESAKTHQTNRIHFFIDEVLMPFMRLSWSRGTKFLREPMMDIPTYIDRYGFNMVVYFVLL